MHPTTIIRPFIFALAMLLFASGAALAQDAQDQDHEAKAACPMMAEGHSMDDCPMMSGDATTCPMMTDAAAECPMKARNGSHHHPAGDDGAHAHAEARTARMAHVHTASDEVQRVEIEVTSSGYSPRAVALEVGVPTEMVFKRTSGSGCAAEVHIPELGVDKTALPQGEAVTISFTPEEPGTFAFLCGMNMLRGEIVVE